MTQKNQITRLERRLRHAADAMRSTGCCKQAMLSLAYVLPDFRSFSTVDYVAYGFNIPDESDLPGPDRRRWRTWPGCSSSDTSSCGRARWPNDRTHVPFIARSRTGVAIAVLAVSARAGSSVPATATDDGRQAGPAAQRQHPLSQANLGEIDPASETIKLATLGLRGVAVNLLWEKANYYKKVEDWTNLTATLEQLAKLQPNFITFWKFQAWNLTYNVSVEFDDYRDRYYYVRRGIEFLQGRRAVQRRQSAAALGPGLVHRPEDRPGGRARAVSPAVQGGRRLPSAPIARRDERDNWLVGKEWYLKAIDAVDNKGKSLGRKSPRDFYSSPAKSQMNYAEAIEEEGFFDKARRGWIKAQEEWEEFGESADRALDRRRCCTWATQPKLDAGSGRSCGPSSMRCRPACARRLVGGEAAKRSPRRASGAWTCRPRSARRHRRNWPIRPERKIGVTDREVAERIAKDDPAKAKQALQLASELERENAAAALHDQLQERQQLRLLVHARQARADARCARGAGSDVPARRGPSARAIRSAPSKLYEEGFAKWRMVFDEFPDGDRERIVHRRRPD